MQFQKRGEGGRMAKSFPTIFAFYSPHKREEVQPLSWPSGDLLTHPSWVPGSYRSGQKNKIPGAKDSSPGQEPQGGCVNSLGPESTIYQITEHSEHLSHGIRSWQSGSMETCEEGFKQHMEASLSVLCLRNHVCFVKCYEPGDLILFYKSLPPPFSWQTVNMSPTVGASCLALAHLKSLAWKTNQPLGTRN